MIAVPHDERSNLETAVARVEEKLDAMKGRVDRIEWVIGIVAIAIISAIVRYLS